MTRPLYPETPDRRIASLRRDVEMLKRRQASGAVVGYGRAVASGTQTVTANPTSPLAVDVVYDPANFGDDGSGKFFFDNANPEFVQCSVSPAQGFWVITATFTHDNSVPTGLDPAKVQAVVLYSSPTNVSFSFPGVPGPKSYSTINDPIWDFEVMAQIPSRGDTTPIGFSIEVSNYSAIGQDMNLGGAKLMVSLAGA